MFCGGDTHLVLDLAAVTDLDAVALGAILSLDSRCRSHGISLEIVPPEGQPGEALILCGGFGRLCFAGAARAQPLAAR
jgi:anti-anti-sigma regulatory factor